MDKKGKVVAGVVTAGILLAGGVTGGVAASQRANEIAVQAAEEKGYENGLADGTVVYVGHTDEELEQAKTEVREEEQLKAAEAITNARIEEQAKTEEAIHNVRLEEQAAAEELAEVARQEGYEAGYVQCREDMEGESAGTESVAYDLTNIKSYVGTIGVSAYGNGYLTKDNKILYYDGMTGVCFESEDVFFNGTGNPNVRGENIYAGSWYSVIYIRNATESITRFCLFDANAQKITIMHEDNRSLLSNQIQFCMNYNNENYGFVQIKNASGKWSVFVVYADTGMMYEILSDSDGVTSFDTYDIDENTTQLNVSCNNSTLNGTLVYNYADGTITNSSGTVLKTIDLG